MHLKVLGRLLVLLFGVIGGALLTLVVNWVLGFYQIPSVVWITATVLSYVAGILYFLFFGGWKDVTKKNFKVMQCIALGFFAPFAAIILVLEDFAWNGIEDYQ